MSTLGFILGFITGVVYTVVVVVVVQVKYKEYLNKQDTLRKMIRKKLI